MAEEQDQVFKLNVKYDFPEDDIPKIIKQVEKQYQKDLTTCNKEIKKGEAISLDWECWTGVMDEESSSDIEQVLKKYNDLYFKQLLQKNGEHFTNLTYDFDHSGDLQHQYYFKYLLGNYFKQLQNTQIRQISITLFQSGPLGGQENTQIFLENFGQSLRNLKGTNVNTLKLNDGDEEISMDIGHFNQVLVKNLNHEQFNHIIFESRIEFNQFFTKESEYFQGQENPQWFQELNNVPNIQKLDFYNTIYFSEFEDNEGKELLKSVLKEIQGLKYIKEFNFYINDEENPDNNKLITDDEELMDIISKIKENMEFSILIGQDDDHEKLI